MAQVSQSKRKEKLGSRTAHAAKAGKARFDCFACVIPALNDPKNMLHFLSDEGKRGLCKKHKEELLNYFKKEILQLG